MTRERATTAALLVVAYTGLTVLFTYPLAWSFDTHHIGDAAGDAKVYLWNYWWVERALFELGTSPFQTDAIFHPIGIGLSLHTLSLAQAIVAAPLNALFGPVASANLIVSWTFIASAFAAWALARHLGASAGGAFLAGLAFAFCPYRLARLSGHYDLLGTEWIPLYLLCVFTIAGRERFPTGLCLAGGLTAAALGYTTLSYLAFMFFFTVLFLVYHRKRFAVLAPRFALVGAVVLLLLAPLLLNASRDLTEWSYPSYPGADHYVADALGFFVPPPHQTFVPGAALSDNVTETTVFPGLVLLALAAFGRRHRFWLISSAVFFVLSLGSSLHVAGTDTGIPLPFRLISVLPGLDQLRAPSRFAILVVLALAMMMALSWAPRRKGWTFLAAGLLVFEYLSVPAPLFSSEVSDAYHRLAEIPGDATVVEIPGIDQSSPDLMFHQRSHGKPIFIGFAARVPTEKSDYWFGIPLIRPLTDLRRGKLDLTPALVERERASAPAVAKFLNIGYFVIDKAFEKRGVGSFIENVLPVDVLYEDEARRVLHVRADDLPANPVVIRAGEPVSRQHFESGWMVAEPGDGSAFRWAHRERSTVLFRVPPGARQIVVEVAPLDGVTQIVRAEIDRESLGSFELAPGWQELRWPISGGSEASSVRRLTLRWSTLRQASDRDARVLAARVRSLRFE